MKTLKIIKITELTKFDINEVVQFIHDDCIAVVAVETNSYGIISECIPYLSKDQIEIMWKYRKESDRINYAVTKAIVNLLFSKIEKLKCEEIRWRYGKYNKPYIRNHLNLHFNISHTTGFSIVAFSRNDIGVDIENIERNIDYSEIKNNFFINNEKILGLKDFYKYWVSKEAYLKYKGVGLIQNLETVDVINKNNNV